MANKIEEASESYEQKIGVTIIAALIAVIGIFSVTFIFKMAGCERIEDEAKRDDCYLEVANFKQNPSICKKIKD